MYLYSKLQSLDKNISVCFIGCGKFISMFLSQYNQLQKIKIAAIVDINIEKAKSNCKNSGLSQKTIDQIQFTNSLDEALKKDIYLGSIRVQGGFGFLRDVGQLRDRGLHAEGHLVGFDARDGLRVTQFAGAFFVERRQVVQQLPTLGAIDRRRVLKVEHRISAWAQANPLVIGGEEAAAPETGEDRLAGILAGALGDHGDERR